MYITIGLIVYLALGSISLGYLFMRIGWPSIRKLDESYKTGWSIILGLAFSALTGVLGFAVGFGYGLWIAPTIISIFFIVLIGILALKQKFPKKKKMKVAVPKEFIAAKRIAKNAVPAKTEPQILFKTKMDEQQKIQLKKFLENKKYEEEEEKKRNTLAKEATEKALRKLEEDKKSKKKKTKAEKIEKKETEKKKTAEKEKGLEKKPEEEELSEIEKEIKAVVSAKTKQEEELIESKKEKHPDTSQAVAQAAVIEKLDSEKVQEEKIGKPKIEEEISAPETKPKEEKKSFFGKLWKRREPDVKEKTEKEIMQAVETHKIQKAIAIAPAEKEPEKKPEELSSEDEEMAGKFEKELFMVKKEAEPGKITATEEEKEAIADAMNLAKIKEAEKERKIEKKAEESKKKEEVRKIFDAIKEVKVRELFEKDGKEKERLSPRLRRMRASYKEGIQEEELMAESLFEQIHAREKEEKTPQDDRITNAIYEQIAEISAETQRKEALKHAMHKVRKFKEREGRYPNQEEGNEIAKEISVQFEKSGKVIESEKLTPRERHELRKQQTEKPEKASEADAQAIQKPAETPAEKLSRRELRKLERQKAEAQDKKEEGEIQTKPMDEEALPLAEPTRLEQNVDTDAPSSEKISDMSVKDLFEKKVSLDLDDIDTKDDEFNLNLEEIDEDVDNVQQEIDTDKNKCPNCKTPTNDLVFCPECGTGFCPNCAKQAKKVGDRIHYTCPSCNYELKVRVR